MSTDPIEEAVGLHDLAVSAREQGDYEKAKSLSLQALEIFEREEGPDHPDVANVLNNLASVYEEEAD